MIHYFLLALLPLIHLRPRPDPGPRILPPPPHRLLHRILLAHPLLLLPLLLHPALPLPRFQSPIVVARSLPPPPPNHPEQWKETQTGLRLLLPRQFPPPSSAPASVALLPSSPPFLS